jgi:hypothetical protein
MDGTEGSGMPSCGSLVSKSGAAEEASGMDGAMPAGKAGAVCPRKNSLAMRVNTAASGNEPPRPMPFSSTGGLSVNRTAEPSALF